MRSSVRGADARAKHLRTIDDAARLAPQWQAGFGYEFLERADGYPGLAKAYGLTFRRPPQVMDLTLSYRALASGQVDLIAGDATAGLIKSLDLVQLEDNRHYFPPYDAVPSGAGIDAAPVSASAESTGRPGRPNLAG